MDDVTYEKVLEPTAQGTGSQTIGSVWLSEAQAAWKRNSSGEASTFADGPNIVLISSLKGMHVPGLALEPNRQLAGTIETFVQAMDNSPSNIGLKRLAEAEQALLKLGETEGWIPTPKTTPYFNLKKGRYVFTEKGGWIDMVHFLFYAGKALAYKQSGEKHPAEKAIRDGEWQEFFDPLHSRYSYEDLPSDRFGADFAINSFDPKSGLTLSQQIGKYFKDNLGATIPERAPNYSELPMEDSKNPPSRINKSTAPIHAIENI